MNQRSEESLIKDALNWTEPNWWILMVNECCLRLSEACFGCPPRSSGRCCAATVTIEWSHTSTVHWQRSEFVRWTLRSFLGGACIDWTWTCRASSVHRQQSQQLSGHLWISAQLKIEVKIAIQIAWLLKYWVSSRLTGGRLAINLGTFFGPTFVLLLVLGSS